MSITRRFAENQVARVVFENAEARLKRFLNTRAPKNSPARGLSAL
jgi:hypothetical protein